MKAAVSPRVLHLATHGFFLSDQDFKRTNALRDSWIGNSQTRWNVSLPKDDWENPLVRCGIALAGANHAGQITNAVAEDGVLTGLEASLLNLQGTELVILSACDSGTGEVKIGEGVMGWCPGSRRTGTARARGECGECLWISLPDRKWRWVGVLWV